MAYEPPADLPTPQRDPVADEQDLLTIAEAASRLHEQLIEARGQLASVDADGDTAQTDRAAALRERIEVLEQGMQRYDTLRRERAR
jgi:hypothetical protein